MPSPSFGHLGCRGSCGSEGQNSGTVDSGTAATGVIDVPSAVVPLPQDNLELEGKTNRFMEDLSELIGLSRVRPLDFGSIEIGPHEPRTVNCLGELQTETIYDADSIANQTASHSSPPKNKKDNIRPYHCYRMPSLLPHCLGNRDGHNIDEGNNPKNSHVCGVNEKQSGEKNGQKLKAREHPWGLHADMSYEGGSIVFRRSSIFLPCKGTREHFLPYNHIAREHPWGLHADMSYEGGSIVCRKSSIFSPCKGTGEQFFPYNHIEGNSSGDHNVDDQPYHGFGHKIGRGNSPNYYLHNRHNIDEGNSPEISHAHDVNEKQSGEKNGQKPKVREHPGGLDSDISDESGSIVRHRSTFSSLCRAHYIDEGNSSGDHNVDDRPYHDFGHKVDRGNNPNYYFENQTCLDKMSFGPGYQASLGQFPHNHPCGGTPTTKNKTPRGEEKQKHPSRGISMASQQAFLAKNSRENSSLCHHEYMHASKDQCPSHGLAHGALAYQTPMSHVPWDSPAQVVDPVRLEQHPQDCSGQGLTVASPAQVFEYRGTSVARLAHMPQVGLSGDVITDCQANVPHHLNRRSLCADDHGQNERLGKLSMEQFIDITSIDRASALQGYVQEPRYQQGNNYHSNVSGLHHRDLRLPSYHTQNLNCMLNPGKDSSGMTAPKHSVPLVGAVGKGPPAEPSGVFPTMAMPNPDPIDLEGNTVFSPPLLSRQALESSSEQRRPILLLQEGEAKAPSKFMEMHGDRHNSDLEKALKLSKQEEYQCSSAPIHGTRSSCYELELEDVLRLSAAEAETKQLLLKEEEEEYALVLELSENNEQERHLKKSAYNSDPDLAMILELSKKAEYRGRNEEEEVERALIISRNEPA